MAVVDTGVRAVMLDIVTPIAFFALGVPLAACTLVVGVLLIRGALRERRRRLIDTRVSEHRCPMWETPSIVGRRRGEICKTSRTSSWASRRMGVDLPDVSWCPIVGAKSVLARNCAPVIAHACP